MYIHKAVQIVVKLKRPKQNTCFINFIMALENVHNAGTKVDVSNLFFVSLKIFQLAGPNLCILDKEIGKIKLKSKPTTTFVCLAFKV